MLYRTITSFITSLTFLALCTFSSCRHDEVYIENVLNGETIDVPFDFVLPVVNTVDTRALADDRQKTVETLHVLVFNSDNEYLYTSKGYKPSEYQGTNKFSVKLTKGEHSFIILANADAILAACYPAADITYKEPKSEVEERLILTQPGQWTASTLPMWANMDAIEISSSSDFTGEGAFTLSRMHAAIDVTSTATGFSITEVYFCNASTKGRLVPDYTDADIWDAETGYAITPTEPTPDGYTPGTTDLQYEVTNSACVNEIYIPEAPAGTKDNHADNPHLIVKSNEGYYRIDLATVSDSGDPGTDATVAYLPLLRNHRYEVTITGVNSPGHSTLAAASASVSNLQTTVTAWNDTELYDIKRDGNDVLGVSKTSITIPWNQTTAEFTLRRAGRPATLTPNNCSTTAAGSITSSTATITITMSGNNTTASAKTATAEVKLGTLSTKVTVTQQAKLASAIRIYDSKGTEIQDGATILFSSEDYRAGAWCTFRVDWTDKSEALYLETSNVTGLLPFVWQSKDAGDFLAPGQYQYLTGLGTRNFRIWGQAFKDADRTGETDSAVKLTFKVNNTEMEKSIIVRQWSPYVSIKQATEWVEYSAQEQELTIATVTHNCKVELPDATQERFTTYDYQCGYQTDPILTSSSIQTMNAVTWGTKTTSAVVVNTNKQTLASLWKRNGQRIAIKAPVGDKPEYAWHGDRVVVLKQKWFVPSSLIQFSPAICPQTNKPYVCHNVGGKAMGMSYALSPIADAPGWHDYVPDLTWMTATSPFRVPLLTDLKPQASSADWHGFHGKGLRWHAGNTYGTVVTLAPPADIGDYVCTLVYDDTDATYGLGYMSNLLVSPILVAKAMELGTFACPAIPYDTKTSHLYMYGGLPRTLAYKDLVVQGGTPDANLTANSSHYLRDNNYTLSAASWDETGKNKKIGTIWDPANKTRPYVLHRYIDTLADRTIVNVRTGWYTQTTPEFTTKIVDMKSNSDYNDAMMPLRFEVRYIVNGY